MAQIDSTQAAGVTSVNYPSVVGLQNQSTGTKLVYTFQTDFAVGTKEGIVLDVGEEHAFPSNTVFIQIMPGSCTNDVSVPFMLLQDL